MITQSHPEIINKGWGQERVIVNNADYCGKFLEFKAGAKFSMHFHAKKHETFYVLEGKGVLRGINTELATVFEYALNPGVVLTIEPLSPHQIFAETDIKIIEFSTHHEDSDSYRVFKGDSQKQ